MILPICLSRADLVVVVVVVDVDVVDVVALTLTRIVQSVVTGQAPVTLELRNTPGNTKTQTNQKMLNPCGTIHTDQKATSAI